VGARFLPPLAAFLFFALLASQPAARVHSAEAPAYLALGDSLAFGIGATNPAAEGYVGLVHFELQSVREYAEQGLELENVSQPGATSGDMLEPDGQLDQAIAKIEERQEETAERDDGVDTQVEIISIDIGGNDLLSLAAADSPCIVDVSTAECREAITETLGNLQSNLATILGRLRAAAPDAQIYVIDLYNPYSGTGDERELIANVGVQQVNGVIGAVVSDENLRAELVPIYELFVDRGTQWIASDGIHPNDPGHRVIAEALMAALQDRPVAIPADIAATPAPETAGNSGAENGDENSDGIDWLPLLIAIPLAFLAGAAVAATYLSVRGRA
jgi:lysophospholipase L1-like esterase